MIQGLNLKDIRTHEWRIISCSAITGFNLKEGLAWIVEDARAKFFVFWLIVMIIAKQFVGQFEDKLDSRVWQGRIDHQTSNTKKCNVRHKAAHDMCDQIRCINLISLFMARNFLVGYDTAYVYRTHWVISLTSGEMRSVPAVGIYGHIYESLLVLFLACKKTH